MKEDIVGTRIGIYSVLYECDYKSNDGHRMYHVKCSKCGWETDMQKSHIKIATICNHQNSLGKYNTGKNATKWGNKRIGNIFHGMKQRCYNSNDKAYKFYGAKGIEISEEWLADPIKFEEWSLTNGYADDLTIDRIDSSKDYCPENCRWVTLENNAKYKSTTKLTAVDNNAYTGREWAELCNLGTNTINVMLRKCPEELVIKFIRERLKNPNLTRHSHQTWFDVYGIE